MGSQKIAHLMLAIVLVAMAVLGTGRAGAQTPIAGTNKDRSMEVGGLIRTYHVHIPALAAPSSGFPLLIMLHGGTGNGGRLVQKSGFSQLADQEGFIVAYPDGTGLLQNRYTWNAYGCCGYAQRKNVDDVGFISALIDQMIADFDVDPSRVYVAGFSNGAMMTFRLACELSGKIAAAAPFAGSLNADACPATEPVPILIMNGEDDQNVPVAGGTSDSRGSESQRDRVDKPTAFAVETWVTINGCSSTPSDVDSSVATVSTYAGCTDGATVEQVLVHGLGHQWPQADEGNAFDAPSQIWGFVSQFSKPSANRASPALATS